MTTRRSRATAPLSRSLPGDILILSAIPLSQLRQGILDQSAAAQKRTEKLVTAIETRDAQRLIFGERTLKEVRNDERRLEQAGTTPSNPVAAEKRLQDEFGDNAYARAILVSDGEICACLRGAQ